MGSDSRKAQEAFNNQRDSEELVEIDEFGNIYKSGEAPRLLVRKPTILRDPEGEY